MEIKTKRTIAILLAVCFLVSITATAVSANRPSNRDVFTTVTGSDTGIKKIGSSGTDNPLDYFVSSIKEFFNMIIGGGTEDTSQITYMSGPSERYHQWPYSEIITK